MPELSQLADDLSSVLSAVDIPILILDSDLDSGVSRRRRKSCWACCPATLAGRSAIFG